MKLEVVVLPVADADYMAREQAGSGLPS